MYACIEAAGVIGIEGHAPDVDRRQSLMAGFPGAAVVFGEQDAQGPAADGDAVWIGGVPGGVVESMRGIDAGDGGPGMSTIVGPGGALVLGGGEPESGVVGRLGEMRDHGAGRPGEIPRETAVFAGEDALLRAGEDAARTRPIDADGLGVLAEDAFRAAGPGFALVQTHADAVRQGEVDVIWLMGVDGDVFDLGHLPAGGDFPGETAVG